ncbi:hypothetical protein VTJ83DRAFT_2862 [Remersonia thermophila]|uniref:Uncharacterized protein n=1 Tax=Remersonia thermophila TaxID=72144 RepID=A0ABR4DCE3_9PEZI
MCYFKRAFWDCGCPLGVAPAGPCEHKGTPACKRRHLLEKIRTNVACPMHIPPGGYPKRKKWVRWFYKVHPDGRVTRHLPKKKKKKDKTAEVAVGRPVAAEATDTIPSSTGATTSGPASEPPTTPGRQTMARSSTGTGTGTGEGSMAASATTSTTGLPTPQSTRSITNTGCVMTSPHPAPGSPYVDRAARKD